MECHIFSHVLNFLQILFIVLSIICVEYLANAFGSFLSLRADLIESVVPQDDQLDIRILCQVVRPFVDLLFFQRFKWRCLKRKKILAF